MKDATGELSMTAVAVIAIAAISVVFSTLIWPTIKASISRSTHCSQAFDCVDGQNGMKTCKYCADESCSSIVSVQCSSNTGESNSAATN